MNLNDEIAALNSLLVRYGEHKKKLSSVNSPYDAKRALKQFAGMGSLSDLYICKMNGHNIDQGEETSVNTMIHTHLNNIRLACADLTTNNT